MKHIDFITSVPEGVASEAYKRAFEPLLCDNQNQIDKCKSDIILTMGYPSDEILRRQIRQTKPSSKIGIVDPRFFRSRYDTKNFDFFVINSFEKTTITAHYRKAVFKYLEYPFLNNNKIFCAEPKVRKPIRLLYHGNLVHLQATYLKMGMALEELAKEFDFELRVLCNFSHLGGWKFARPKVKIREINWSIEALNNELKEADIGLVPAFLPLQTDMSKLNKFYMQPSKLLFNQKTSDQVMSYKSEVNAGRAIVFSQYSIPCVADATPSNCSVIKDGENGFLSLSKEQWLVSLSRLLESEELRRGVGKKFADVFSDFSFEKQNAEFLKFLETLPEEDEMGLVLESKTNSKDNLIFFVYLLYFDAINIVKKSLRFLLRKLT